MIRGRWFGVIAGVNSSHQGCRLRSSRSRHRLHTPTTSGEHWTPTALTDRPCNNVPATTIATTIAIAIRQVRIHGTHQGCRLRSSRSRHRLHTPTTSGEHWTPVALTDRPWGTDIGAREKTTIRQARNRVEGGNWHRLATSRRRSLRLVVQAHACIGTLLVAKQRNRMGPQGLNGRRSS